MNTRFLGIAASLMLTVLFTGCVAVVGNRDSLRGNNTTLGQELIDLKKALDAGAVTGAEYETQRARLLERKK